MTTQPTVKAGIMPLVDCALLVVAHEQGFANNEGFALKLHKETSWATLRDRVAYRHLDCAQMLAPIPIASSLGMGHAPVEMIAPMALGLGGNGFTVSLNLWAELQDCGATPANDPAMMGEAFAKLVARRALSNQPQLTLGVVHPFSGHNYELRYWLAAAGVNPDLDLKIIVVPPFLIADALGAGELDGFCAGEPWSSVAVDKGLGRLALSKSAIWRQSPEKVLAMRADWQVQNPELTSKLIRALAFASLWCADPANHSTLADMLSAPAYVGIEARLILPSLSGRMLRQQGEKPEAITDFLHFAAHSASFPWVSHGLWFYSQMARWGHVPLDPQAEAKVRQCYRPDLYRTALKDMAGIMLPTASAKVEGALESPTHVGSTPAGLVLGPDGFFDGKRFDPDTVASYVDSFLIKYQAND
jgi:NitT/TauT family transport system ATP-binding protein